MYESKGKVTDTGEWMSAAAAVRVLNPSLPKRATDTLFNWWELCL